MTIFVKLLDVPVDRKAEVLRAALGADGQRFDVDSRRFSQIPGSPFAYWVSSQVRNVFLRNTDQSAAAFDCWVGLQTNEDFRWVRLGWEVPAGSLAAWRPFAKGGAQSKFYADIFLVVRWGEDGRDIKEWKTDQLRLGNITANNSRCWNESHYFRPGITWPSRTQSGLGMRAMPSGSIFAHKGPAAFVERDEPESLLALLAITTSSIFRFCVDLQMAFGSYEVGVIQRTPIPALTSAERETFANLARRAWSIKRTLDAATETSHAFILPRLLLDRVISAERTTLEQALSGIEVQIDDKAFALYGIEDRDRDVVSQWGKSGSQSSPEGNDSAQVDEDESDQEGTSDNEALLSWAFGVAFGRFDIRLATGECQPPPEPEPFAPLCILGPGLAPQVPSRAVFVDDSGHGEDLVASVQRVLERIQQPVPAELRAWFGKAFFPLHIKMYSRSRRKAPVYWQLATPSASYSVWLYIHALTKDTLYTVQKDYVELKLRHEERRLTSLRQDFGSNPTGAQRRELVAQETFTEELRTLLDEVKRIAPLWSVNLDDGVVIAFAPLWRLVSHHKAWQKELKANWDALCDGAYDWAHLAMHLWPERVVPRCAEDRSLAIAHDLEEVFWVKMVGGKWQPRAKPTRSLEELVSDRTSPAVKAALKSLLEAPAPAGGAPVAQRKKATSGRRKPAAAES